MARLDVYTYRGDVPFLVDVQADIFAEIGSHLVIPLLRSEDVRPEAMLRLKPPLIIQNEEYRLIRLTSWRSPHPTWEARLQFGRPTLGDHRRDRLPAPEILNFMAQAPRSGA